VRDAACPLSTRGGGGVLGAALDGGLVHPEELPRVGGLRARGGRVRGASGLYGAGERGASGLYGKKGARPVCTGRKGRVRFVGRERHLERRALALLDKPVVVNLEKGRGGRQRGAGARSASPPSRTTLFADRLSRRFTAEGAPSLLLPLPMSLLYTPLARAGPQPLATLWAALPCSAGRAVHLPPLSGGGAPGLHAPNNPRAGGRGLGAGAARLLKVL